MTRFFQILCGAHAQCGHRHPLNLVIPGKDITEAAARVGATPQRLPPQGDWDTAVPLNIADLERFARTYCEAVRRTEELMTGREPSAEPVDEKWVLEMRTSLRDRPAGQFFIVEVAVPHL